MHAPIQTKLNGALTQYTYTATGNRMTMQDGLYTTTYHSNDDNQIKSVTRPTPRP